MGVQHLNESEAAKYMSQTTVWLQRRSALAPAMGAGDRRRR